MTLSFARFVYLERSKMREMQGNLNRTVCHLFAHQHNNQKSVHIIHEDRRLFWLLSSRMIYENQKWNSIVSLITVHVNIPWWHRTLHEKQSSRRMSRFFCKPTNRFFESVKGPRILIKNSSFFQERERKKRLGEKSRPTPNRGKPSWKV